MVAVSRTVATMISAGCAKNRYLPQAGSVILAGAGANRISVAIDWVECLLLPWTCMRPHIKQHRGVYILPSPYQASATIVSHWSVLISAE